MNLESKSYERAVKHLQMSYRHIFTDTFAKTYFIKYTLQVNTYILGI